jgi:hypothetical protein
MFICDMCHSQRPEKESPYMYVAERRSKVYTQLVEDKHGNTRAIEVGQGWEIAKEIKIGQCCLEGKSA